jgi:hypothetical protein
MKDDDRIAASFLSGAASRELPPRKALGKSLDGSRFSAENGGFVAWEEMVLMAYLLWTRCRSTARTVTRRRVFPPLAQLVTLTAWIPEYQVIALRDEARRRRMDVSELVSDDISVFREVAENERLDRA